MTRPKNPITAPLLAIALVGFLPACASKPETKPTPMAARPFVEQHPQVPKEAPSETTAAVYVSDEIAHACGISDEDSYFAFDSAKLTTEDVKVLSQVATCFVSGPLKDRKMKLVGRADPRGSAEYNMSLGQHRADDVKKYLAAKGVEAQRIESTSRGKMDAVGTDEPTWAHDRRVDVLLD